jgi:hypothetical protein
MITFDTAATQHITAMWRLQSESLQMATAVLAQKYLAHKSVYPEAALYLSL